MSEEQKPKSGWGIIGGIIRNVVDGANKNEPQRPARSGIRTPKPRKPCGGCGGK
jgi:hypothetical protein